MHPATRRILSGILSLTADTGCGAGTDAPQRVVVRGSAGVRIVESSWPAWTEGAGWRASGTPALPFAANQ